MSDTKSPETYVAVPLSNYSNSTSMAEETRYTEILNLLVACPLRLPLIPDLLSQPKTQIKHPKPELFQLTAWMLSKDITKRQDFLKTLGSYSRQHGGRVHKDYSSKSSIP